ncbi:actin maturation protease, partial [Vidua macroura]|uniref:actin maturation protease n=1 Tax=Vidua macroura TaxID=187451 RepID=UPI0023A822D1
MINDKRIITEWDCTDWDKLDWDKLDWDKLDGQLPPLPRFSPANQRRPGRHGAAAPSPAAAAAAAAPRDPRDPPRDPRDPREPPGLRRVLREALQRAGEALGEDGGLRELLRRRKDSLAGPWKWLLFHRPVPPLIQDGPQCGLVALAMAGALLGPPGPNWVWGLCWRRRGPGATPARGRCSQPPTCPRWPRSCCRAGPSCSKGGLGGPNRARLLRHLLRGRPLLLP